MVTDSRVLVLDEPTSSLDRGEVEQLFAVIRDLRDRGVAILFVSHFLDQVFEISDRITVLRNGKLVGESLAADLTRGELVAQDARPRARRAREHLARRPTARSTAAATPCSTATGIGRRGMLEPADLEVYDGEVVGIAGLLGSGRTELVRLLYGADHADSGRVELRGEPVRLTSPRHAIDHRIAFSSEDRRAEGIIGDLTVAENIVLGIQARRGWLRKIGRTEQDAIVAEYIDVARRAPGRPVDPEPQPLRRQPAEGAARPLARHRAAAADPRRADPRHRRRREGRHPAQGRRTGRARACRSSSSRPSSKRSCASRSASS